MYTLKSPIVVYKGAVRRTAGQTAPEPVLVVLLLPKGTKVNRKPEGSGKHRASRAKVLSIESPNGLQRFKTATSRGNFRYRLGKTARPEEPFETGDWTCASGIHFYMRRREALQWVNVYGDAQA